MGQREQHCQACPALSAALAWCYPTAAQPLVFSVLEHIATGMAYIHSKNIIHGDLK